MNYQRVTPRDLFNESKLLKCLGQLSLFILDGKLLKFQVEEELLEPKRGFVIQQDEDGNISCVNYHVFCQLGVEGRVPLKLFTSLNSRLNYPLCCETMYGEIIEVFESSGKLTKEFTTYLKVLNNFKA
jgi:hypothetical protein